MRRITRGRKKNRNIRKAVTPTPAKDMSVVSGNNNDDPGTETDTSSSSGDDIEVVNVRKRKRNSDGKGKRNMEDIMAQLVILQRKLVQGQEKIAQGQENIVKGQENIANKMESGQKELLKAISTILDRNQQAAPVNNVDENGRERFLSDLTSDSIAATHNEVKEEVKKTLRRLIHDDFFPRIKFVFPPKNGDPTIADEIVAKAIDSRNVQVPTNHPSEREFRKFGADLVKTIYNEKRQQFQTGMRKKWMGKYRFHTIILPCLSDTASQYTIFPLFSYS